MWVKVSSLQMENNTIYLLLVRSAYRFYSVIYIKRGVCFTATENEHFTLFLNKIHNHQISRREILSYVLYSGGQWFKSRGCPDEVVQ